jgi:hypothetical protein
LSSAASASVVVYGAASAKAPMARKSALFIVSAP